MVRELRQSLRRAGLSLGQAPIYLHPSSAKVVLKLLFILRLKLPRGTLIRDQANITHLRPSWESVLHTAQSILVQRDSKRCLRSEGTLQVQGPITRWGTACKSYLSIPSGLSNLGEMETEFRDLGNTIRQLRSFISRHMQDLSPKLIGTLQLVNLVSQDQVSMIQLTLSMS